MAMAGERDPVRFWRKLTARRWTTRRPSASAAAREALLDDSPAPERADRDAGSVPKPGWEVSGGRDTCCWPSGTAAGSPARRRRSRRRRPSWLAGRGKKRSRMGEAVARAVPVPDPFYRPGATGSCAGSRRSVRKIDLGVLASARGRVARPLGDGRRNRQRSPRNSRRGQAILRQTCRVPAETMASRRGASDGRRDPSRLARFRERAHQ